MADDKTKQPASDRARVAAGQPGEVAYFARKHGISADETRALIADVGNDRKTLEAAVAAKSAAKAPSTAAKPRTRATAKKPAAGKAPAAKTAEPSAPAAKTRGPRSTTAATAPHVQPRKPRASGRTSAAPGATRRTVSATAARGVKATRRVAATAQGFVADLPAKTRLKTRAVVDRAPGLSTVAAFSMAGVAVAGALLGFVLLRGRSPDPAGKAHRADGTDDSASFGARIADEGTIPDVTPSAESIVVS